jgi:hypothetical protein
MTVPREPRLVDVRQIGPRSERDISGRCSACDAILIARLDNWEEVTPEQLRNKLDKVFDRHIAESKCGENPSDSVAKTDRTTQEYRR